MDRPGCVAADQQIWDELQLARFQVNLQMVSSALVQKINTNTVQAEKENELYLDQLEEPDLLGEKDYIDIQSSTNHGTPWDTPIKRVINCG